MKLMSILISLFLVTSSHAAIIKGKVIDSEDGTALEAVAVFINGSSIGTLSGADGSFELEGNFVFPVDLVIQALSYETKLLKVSAAGALPVVVRLSSKVSELEGFQVLAPLKDGWTMYGKDFLESFLSYSDLSRQCEILNKDVVQFKVDNDAGILYVTADAPIRIRNKALGYVVYFDLQDFRLNYADKTTHFAGYSRFESMKSKSKKQLKKWEDHRRSAYLGSLNHFIRAAYNNKVAEEGFQLNVVVRAPAAEYGERVPVWRDTFRVNEKERMKDFWTRFADAADSSSSLDTARLITTVMGQKAWFDTATVGQAMNLFPPFADTLSARKHRFVLEKIDTQQFIAAYFDTGRLPPSVISPFDDHRITSDDTAMLNRSKARFWERAAAAPFNYIYSTPYPIDSFLVIENGKKSLFSEDLVQVMYKMELEEMPYQERHYKCGGPNKPCGTPAPQTSILVFPQQRSVTLMENGNFYEQYDLFLEGYWSYEKLDKMLPIDYEPQ